MSYNVLSSHSTVVVTTSTTVLSYVTATLPFSAFQAYTATYPTSTPEPSTALVSAIEGLNDCSQAIVFQSLADSSCNPADFLCICAELRAQGVSNSVASKCQIIVAEQYNDFQSDVCRNVRPVVSPVTPSSCKAPSVVIVTATPTPSPPTSASPPPVIFSSYPYGNTTVPAVYPVGNTTTPVESTTTTQIYQVGSTDSASVSATTQSVVESVVPSPATSSGPATPQYTGAASSTKTGALAGAVVFFGLVFAAL